MGRPSVSVVVVSHGRPESLLWCLTALAGVRYAPFEIVVVADKAGCSAVLETDFARRVKLVRFDEANISAARNAGILQAAGEIVAFIDDDAAAEPMWLAHLVAPFGEPEIASTGGYVRGRNGISFQWKAREVDQSGRAFALDARGPEPFVPMPSAGRAVKTEGTNMAVRRSVLAELGGFDEAYHFYLDETDLNLRLAEAGHKSALVPRAEVHHAYRASARRKDDRAVTDLFDIGASSVVMLRKFGAPMESRLGEIREEQHARLEDQVKRGLMDKAAMSAVLESLEHGIRAGRERTFGCYLESHETAPDFVTFTPDRNDSLVIAGRWGARDALRREAEEAARQGQNVSLYLFSLDPRFHRVRFDARGFWEQAGGIFGRSERSEPLFRLYSRAKRLEKERARTAHARG